jgi:hypothetical protein
MGDEAPGGRNYNAGCSRGFRSQGLNNKQGMSTLDNTKPFEEPSCIVVVTYPSGTFQNLGNRNCLECGV